MTPTAWQHCEPMGCQGMFCRRILFKWMVLPCSDAPACREETSILSSEDRHVSHSHVQTRADAGVLGILEVVSCLNFPESSVNFGPKRLLWRTYAGLFHRMA